VGQSVELPIKSNGRKVWLFMLKHEIHILALVGKEKCIIHNLLKKIARPAKLNKNGKKQYTREAVRAGKFMSAKRTWTLRKK